MWLLPAWAPNLHPLVVHFPIALVVAAVTADVVHTLTGRPAWLGAGVTTLYTAGAVTAWAAWFTGTQAAATVFVPGMANPVVEAHRTWALVTACYLAALALARVGADAARFASTRRRRLLLLAAGIVAMVLLQQTAERGAELVFQHGVGVIPAAGVR